MEAVLKLFALCLVGAVFALLLREEKQLLAFFVTVALVLAAMPVLFESLEEIFAFYDTLCALSALPKKVFAPMVKVVGIAAASRIGTSLCKEADADTAAALLEMGGTCCALLVSLPLMTMVLDLLQQML